MNTEARDLEIRLRWIYKGTVALFATAFSAGLVLHVVQPGGAASDRLLQFGLVVLMLAPASRVLIAVAERVRRRDWTFVLLTVIVAVELAIVMFRAAQKA